MASTTGPQPREGDAVDTLTAKPPALFTTAPAPMGKFSSPSTPTSAFVGVLGSFAIKPFVPISKPSTARSKAKVCAPTSISSAPTAQPPSPSSSPSIPPPTTGLRLPFCKWSTFRWTPDTAPQPVDFQLVPSKDYHYDSSTSLSGYDDVLKSFTRITTLRSRISRSLSSTANDKDNAASKQRFLEIQHKALAHAVFTSNFIERAGLSSTLTATLCVRIFAGKAVVAENISADDPTLAEHFENLIPSTKAKTEENAVLGRREVIQHAKAMMHILRKMVLDDEPLSEELILGTHAILVSGLDIQAPDGEVAHEWETYAGRFREGDEHVCAGTTNFVSPNAIPNAMSALMGSFTSAFRAAESACKIDPVYLAAKFCQEFVLIHPFLDGNGRMCRLLLNALLMRYLGVVVGVGGGTEEGREAYIGVCRRAGEDMEGCGELAGMVLGLVEGEMGRVERELGV